MTVSVELGRVITIFAVLESVKIVKLVWWHWQSAGDETEKSTSGNRDSPSQENAGHLHSHLVAHGSVAFRILTELGSQVNILLKVKLISGNANHCDDRSESAWNSVKELHTTGIMKLELVLAELVKLEVAKSGDDSSDCTRKHSKAWDSDHVCGSAHHNTTGEG